MRVIGIVLAVATVLWTGLNVLQVTAGSASRTEHRLYAAPRELTIDVAEGDVKIERATGGRLVLDSKVTGSLRKPRLRSELRDGKLHLGVSCRWFDFRCSGSFTVRVPEGTHVTVKADSGDLSASGLTAGGSLQTDSGDISVTGAAGTLKLGTDSGNISAAELRSGGVTAHTDSGDLSLAFLIAPTTVATSTDSGDVSIEVPRTGDSYNVTRSTDSGSERVDVRTDPISPRRVDAHTDSGDIRVEYR